MNRIPQQVRLDPDIMRILREIAAEDGEPNVSLVIRRALRASPIIKTRLEARRQPMPAGVGSVA